MFLLLLVAAVALSLASALTTAVHGGGGDPTWSPQARDAVVPRGDSEHVVLADCKAPKNHYFESSQMAYFAGPPDSSPNAITNVTYGKQQAWAGAGKITGVFPDKAAFSVEIPAAVEEGQFAGNAYNGYWAFACYARFMEALYTTKDGTVCNGVYDCDHVNPPATTSVSTPSPTMSTLPPILPIASTTPSPTPTPTPTTLLTSILFSAPPPALKTDGKAQGDDAHTSSGGLSGSRTTGPSSSSSTGPSSSSSTTASSPTATSTNTDSRDAPDTSNSRSLNLDQKIALGVGIASGASTLIAAVLALLFPKNKAPGSGQGRRHFRYSSTETKKKRVSISWV
ncbi:hypothetical protein B0T24DRAFT_136397 [Lasiosphaeria ovina]|uniref:Uncharacterized protein n=1 Tax=Lasiosphaeria ovina TaxID=92902 RepID=A0AAE0NCI3_9PEZI|nr:hypothetical protein B0T24DRAFT_136397 [Lasiosphaeria ovina]